MLRPLVSVLLALCPLAQAQESPSGGHPDVARVEVRKGRAVIHTKSHAERTLRKDQDFLVEGPGHIEVGAGSEVTLSWTGRASMHLWGPAAIQWAPLSGGSDVRTNDMPRHSEAGLEWRVFDLAWADVEVRRGAHVLRLPGDWRMDCAVGAWHLRSLPSGPLELRHHAGSPMTLTWLGDPSQARPPMTVYSGSSLRIDRPQVSPADETKNADAWDRADWPWRDERDTPAQREERERIGRETTRVPGFPTRDPRVRGPVGSIKGLAEPEDVRVEVTPRTERKPLSPLGDGPAVQRRKSTEPVPRSTYDRMPAPTSDSPERATTRPAVPQRSAPPARSVPRPEPPSTRVNYDPEQWRGLALRDLNAAGAVAVQRTSGAEVRVFASGRYKVFVDALAGEPVWCFAPGKDYRMQPGAVAVFEKDGTLRLRFGDIEEHEPLTGRPAFDHLAR